MRLISVVTFRANDVQRLFQVNQKVPYVGLFAKSKSAFKVRDLRYLNESRWRRDSLFHIASVLGILIDDWDILVSHSCLFVTRGRIQTIIWRCNFSWKLNSITSKHYVRKSSLMVALVPIDKLAKN